MGELTAGWWGEVLGSGDMMEGQPWRLGGGQGEAFCIQARWGLGGGLWLWGARVGTGLTLRT